LRLKQNQPRRQKRVLRQKVAKVQLTIVHPFPIGEAATLAKTSGGTKGIELMRDLFRAPMICRDVMLW
jgi:hypothetical protein